MIRIFLPLTNKPFKGIFFNFQLSLILLFLHFSCAYEKNDSVLLSLKKSLQNADSVVLVSHITTIEFASKIMPDWNINDKNMDLEKWHEVNSPAPPFLINGQINKNIITESITLSKNEVYNLSNIITREYHTDTLVLIKCDNPRHAILLYKKNMLSYIDICFGCRKIHCSSDIKLTEEFFDDQKWDRLENEFKHIGITKEFD